MDIENENIKLMTSFSNSLLKCISHIKGKASVIYADGFDRG